MWALEVAFGGWVPSAWAVNEAKASGTNGAGDRGQKRRPSGDSSAGGLKQKHWFEALAGVSGDGRRRDATTGGNGNGLDVAWKGGRRRACASTVTVNSAGEQLRRAATA